jgi:hypothetical protein
VPKAFPGVVFKASRSRSGFLNRAAGPGTSGPKDGWCPRSQTLHKKKRKKESKEVSKAGSVARDGTAKSRSLRTGSKQL